MSENAVTIGPKTYDKIGVVHVGVVRDGLITCAGDVANIEDGQEMNMERGGVRVSRKGDEYTFSKAG